MKKRTGFVSNSSSSSFVLIGWKVSEEVFNIAEDHEIDSLEYDDSFIVGIELDRFDDDGNLSVNDIDLDCIKGSLEQIKKELNIDKKPQLFSGTCIDY